MRASDFCIDRGYILCAEQEDIVNSDTVIKYICPVHGVHETKIYSLVLKHGCPECMHEKVINAQRLTQEEVEADFLKYGVTLLNKYDYKNSNYKNLLAVCPECGNVFTTSHYSFLKHNGQRCPKCSNVESSGEYAIRTFLDKNNYEYDSEKRFDDCKYKNTLPFDFYLPEYNIAIEFDGEQHYKPIRRGSMSEDEALRLFE